MHHILYNENAADHPVVVLIPGAALNQGRIREHYLTPIKAKMSNKMPAVAAYSLAYDGKKAPVKLQKAYLAELMPVLKEMGTETLIVADGNYFKTLTKQKKSDPHYGYVLPCALEGYEDMQVALVANYRGLYYNPDLQNKIDLATKAVADHLDGNYQALGSDVIQYADYPTTLESIKAWLKSLMTKPKLTVDIEAHSLKHYDAGLGTITFCWSQHEGIAFPVDHNEQGVTFSSKEIQTIKQWIREFIEDYPGTLIYHNGSYDMKVLVYELWMTHLGDVDGMLEGIEHITRNFDDTKIITYLATNNTARNKLSLKDVAHEFAGNWAQEDIKDINKIPQPELLQYNLVDGLSTWYAYNKNHPVMMSDQQNTIYQEIFKPSVKVILQMELTGMPMDMDVVKSTKAELVAIRAKHMKTLESKQIIESFTELLMEQEREKDFQRRLKAQQDRGTKNPKPLQYKDISAFQDVEFNPGSDLQLQQLLYQEMGLPVLDYTKNKAPACGGKTIAKLIHHTKDPDHIEILEALIGLAEVGIILDTFFAAFEKAVTKGDGRYYLFGNFNLGGTVSGRLSSSGPNLQNIPSTRSAYAKHVKKCFVAPDGWLFCGADFASLEDRISALTTKDPNKLKVYTDGYDGHCLRAYGYFKHMMPDICAELSQATTEQERADIINSIEDRYGDLRQKSKTPTFLLTYGGTWHGLMDIGFSEAESKSIEANYHELYAVSDQWVQSKIQQACNTGYVEVAFGLRVRTPLLSQTVLSAGSVPYEAKKESRTAGNACGQSYGLLNNRSAIEFQQLCLAGPHARDILPIAHIHDAQYFLVRNNAKIIKWVNDRLPKTMLWQDLDEIRHDEVGLGGEFAVFWPNWAYECKLPNGADMLTIRETVKAHLDKLLEKEQITQEQYNNAA